MFTVDNIVMNGYGKQLRTTGIAFYVVLCRYANNQTQQSYPSITTIQNETGMDRKTIINCAKRCEKLKLIKRKVIPGKYTIYTLLEPQKSGWWKIITGGKNTTTGGKNTTTGGKSEENELRERTKRTNLHSKKNFADSFKKDIYKDILQKYQELKGIILQGQEFSPPQHYIKLMLQSKRTPEDIKRCMKWLAESDEEWTQNWKMSTVYKILPEFVAGKLDKDNNVDVIEPEHIKRLRAEGVIK